MACEKYIIDTYNINKVEYKYEQGLATIKCYDKCDDLIWEFIYNGRGMTFAEMDGLDQMEKVAYKLNNKVDDEIWVPNGAEVVYHGRCKRSTNDAINAQRVIDAYSELMRQLNRAFLEKNNENSPICHQMSKIH